jgi:hypothetical protein
MDRILIIRITLWLGIIADAFETIRMSIPNIFIATTEINVINNDSFQFGLFLGVPLMLGWTIVLFWADRKPIERRGILLCLAPVLISYIVVELLGLRLGVINLQNLLPMIVMQSILFCLTVISYFVAEKIFRARGETK